MKILATAAIAASAFAAFAAPNPEAKMHRLSATIEKERPKLDSETMRLIAAYRKNPSEGNRAALKKRVEANYDKVLARKKAKLEDLKKTAKEASKVREMQEIVDEMTANRNLSVERTMSRFSDPRLRPGARTPKDGYLPVLGAAQNVCISYAPVKRRIPRVFEIRRQKRPRRRLRFKVSRGKRLARGRRSLLQMAFAKGRRGGLPPADRRGMGARRGPYVEGRGFQLRNRRQNFARRRLRKNPVRVRGDRHVGKLLGVDFYGRRWPERRKVRGSQGRRVRLRQNGVPHRAQGRNAKSRKGIRKRRIPRGEGKIISSRGGENPQREAEARVLRRAAKPRGAANRL